MDGNGSTPLRTACINLRLEAVRDLLDIGADEKLVGDLSSENADAFVKKTDDGNSTAGASNIATGGARAESIARVVAMLAAAPADRAWGRRGWLAVLRSRHTAQVAATTAAAFTDGTSRNSSSDSGSGELPVTTRKRSCSAVEDNTAAAVHGEGKARRGGGGGGRGGSAASSASLAGGQDLSEVLKMVTSLEDEGVFRKIVLFL